MSESIFKLPDLGEGLVEAEIVEWHVKAGDTINIDQPLVSMETAKAVVEVPSPQSGTIAKLYGKAGDIIETDAPLVAFTQTAATTSQTQPNHPTDEGTVVGKLETTNERIEENFTYGSATATIKRPTAVAKALPAARILAKKLKVDLAQVTPSQANKVISAEDVKRYHEQLKSPETVYQPLNGIRRTMALAMVKSQQAVVPVTIFDDAVLMGWTKNTDITAGLIHAIVKACQIEPALNAWYDGQAISRCLHKHVNLGLAVDTPEGLFVPVIKEADKKDSHEQRQAIDEIKQKITKREISLQILQGATITLSNFGVYAGRYAEPIVLPPCVAIVASGKIRKEPVVVNDKIEIQKVLPLSLTFDHRAVTGGEATRFLGIMITALEKT